MSDSAVSELLKKRFVWTGPLPLDPNQRYIVRIELENGTQLACVGRIEELSGRMFAIQHDGDFETQTHE